MRKFMLAAASAAAFLAVAPAAHAIKVVDPTPTHTFTDADGNAGYVEVDEAGAVRVCNENEATPAGDKLTGYAYVSKDGETFANGPTYGNGNVGAGDTDGEDDGDPATDEGHDCL